MLSKNKKNLLILIVLIIGIPVLVYLALHQQFFKPKAAGGTLEVFGDNIISLSNGQKGFTLNDQGKPIINLRLTSPFGPAANTNSVNTPANNQAIGNTPNANQTPINSNGPSLSLYPASGDQSVGTPFDVKLVLNSGSAAVSFLDLTISYNSTVNIASFTPAPGFNSVVTNGPSGSGSYRVALGNSTSNVLSGTIDVGNIHINPVLAGTATLQVTAREVTTAGPNPVDIQTGGASVTYKIR